jgi:hypothetical protein
MLKAKDAGSLTGTVGQNMRENISTKFRIETPSLVIRPLTLGDTRRMLEMSQ